MTVSRKLRVAFSAYLALVAVVLGVLVHDTRMTFDTRRAASDVGAMLRGVEVPRVPVLQPARDSLARVTAELEQQRTATRVLRDASRMAMQQEYGRSERAARVANSTAWLLFMGAILAAAFLFALLARFDELEHLKRELVSNVSHDLKTPLSSIQESNAALLDGVAGPLTESQRRLLEHSRDSGRRLGSMVTKLLDLSRLETRPRPQVRTVDFADVARRAAERASSARAATVVFASTVRDAPVRGDREDLERVLDNLIENALKFSPPGGTVRVLLSVAPDRMVRLTVADEGPGVRDAEKRRVFERFYQTDVGRAARARGMGLGLSICDRIVREHGGRITVTDNSPRGAIFGVVISLAAAPASVPTRHIEGRAAALTG